MEDIVDISRLAEQAVTLDLVYMRFHVKAFADILDRPEMLDALSRLVEPH